MGLICNVVFVMCKIKLAQKIDVLSKSVNYSASHSTHTRLSITTSSEAFGLGRENTFDWHKKLPHSKSHITKATRLHMPCSHASRVIPYKKRIAAAWIAIELLCKIESCAQ